MSQTPYYGTVERVKYVGRSDNIKNPNKNDTLEVLFAGPFNGSYIHDLTNGGFTYQNPALRFLAYCDARPSNVAACEGTGVELVRNEDSQDVRDDDYFVLSEECVKGYYLEKADWFPEILVD